MLKIFYFNIYIVNLFFINQAISHNTYVIMEQNKDFTLIREWASERGIYLNGDVKTQYIKLMEEAGELGQAILKKDDNEFKDAIGDMVVVLVNLAHLGNTTIEECFSGAWEEIKNRKGKMSNGTFVKNIEVVLEEEYYKCISKVEYYFVDGVFETGKIYVRAPKKEFDSEDVISLYVDNTRTNTFYVPKKHFVIVKENSWEEITEAQLEDFFVRKCKNDYQFNKQHAGYCGFINMNPNEFKREDYDICIYIIIRSSNI